MIVTMCLLAAITGLDLRGMDNNILSQIGTVVFVGMIGVTLFGLILTPVFYIVCRKLGDRLRTLRLRRPAPLDDPLREPAE